jgi:hypothetical protein
MSLKKLVAVIPPPKKPLDCEGNWRGAEIVARAQFPPDFRDLIGRYGTGAFFQGHLTLFNPLTLEVPKRNLSAAAAAPPGAAGAAALGER